MLDWDKIKQKNEEYDRIYKAAWNAAIEEAAMWAGSRPIKEVTDLKDHEKALLVQAAFVYASEQIRKLKK